ncbi:MAG: hypothetical protein ACXIT9_04205 [Nitritalea sp.]
MFKKCKFSVFLALFLCLFSAQQRVTAQSLSNLPEVADFTPVEEIAIVDDYSQVKDLIRVGEAYSKARGTLSYFGLLGLVPSMPDVQHRALSKLKEEASLRGASHIYVKSVAHNGGFGRYVGYVASFYRATPVDLARAKRFMEDKTFRLASTTTLNRKRYKARFKTEDALVGPVRFQDLVEKEGRIFTKTLTDEREKAFPYAQLDKPLDKRGSKQIEGAPRNYYYEVIGISDDHILIASTAKDGRIYKTHLLRKDK